jgi:hypothetical protein
MNKISTFLLSIGISLTLLSVSACENIQLPTLTQSLRKTVSPTVSIFTPTESRTPERTKSTLTLPNSMPFPQSKDYIIYTKYNAENILETWAINPNELIPYLVTSNIVPRSWSPSTNRWLFTQNGSIYIANADGSDIRNIYTNTKYNGFDPYWLTDDVVLFNAFKDIYTPPDMYRLDIISGKVTQLLPGNNQFIQAAFPSEKSWLRGSSISGQLTIANQSGTEERFFNNFSIITDLFAHYQTIQLINNLDKYLFQAKKDGDAKYKLWLVSKQEPPESLFDLGSGGVNEFAVSPNEKYVILTYQTLDNPDVFIYIFSLENKQLAYKWVCPYDFGDCNFIWSPDSLSIVLPYCENGTCPSATTGIQVMDITTGETKVILKDDVIKIIDWHSAK